MEDRDEEGGPSDTEQAFEALRAEIAAMCQAVGALPEAFKRVSPAIPRLRWIRSVKELQTVGETLAKIEQHPAISMTPARHQ